MQKCNLLYESSFTGDCRELWESIRDNRQYRCFQKVSAFQRLAANLLGISRKTSNSLTWKLTRKYLLTISKLNFETDSNFWFSSACGCFKLSKHRPQVWKTDEKQVFFHPKMFNFNMRNETRSHWSQFLKIYSVHSLLSEKLFSNIPEHITRGIFNVFEQAAPVSPPPSKKQETRETNR